MTKNLKHNVILVRGISCYAEVTRPILFTENGRECTYTRCNENLSVTCGLSCDHFNPFCVLKQLTVVETEKQIETGET